MDKKEIALKIHSVILYVLTHTENADAHTAFCIQNQLCQEFELVDKKNSAKNERIRIKDLTSHNVYDIILIESEVNEMRKLNYDIKVGTEFKLPKASWQVAEIAGNYRIQERKVKEYEDEDPIVSYICSCIDRPWQKPLEIAEMTLAYLLGEDVSAELGVVFDGKQYQPTDTEPYRVATEYCGTEYSEPFWYLGESGVQYHIDVDFETDRWCFFTLPWD